MIIKDKYRFIIAFFLLLFAYRAQCNDVFPGREYVCPPCYHVEDVFNTKSYHEDGQCPVCGMNLIEEPRVKQGVMQELHVGSGNFQFKSQRSNSVKVISVFYHMPKKYTSDSNILLVVPGAGRNAWDYRDAWVALSEKYNVLVVSPSYPEAEYGHAEYHLAGIISAIEFRNYKVSKAEGRINKYHVADKDILTGNITSSKSWLFQDFDDIFGHVVRLSHSNKNKYDIFGHSAGGQILHRFAMFYSSEKVDRIIASNSGSYTLPSFEHKYPLGIKDIEFQKTEFKKMFSRKLTLLVGEKDNADEQNGTLLHTPFLDKQGLGRLSRGKSFYNESMNTAREIDSEFDWKFCIVEGVGHEYKKMGIAAAKLLYSGQKCITKISI